MHQTAEEIYWINARFLTVSLTGVQRFALELTRALVAKGKKVRLLVPAKAVIEPLDFEAEIISFGAFKGTLWEQIDLPIFLKKKKVEKCLHFANTAPLVVRNHFVVIHDAAVFQKNQQWFSRSFTLWYRFLLPKIAQRNMVGTVSQFSVRELSNYLSLPEKEITILYNGVSYPLQRAKVDQPPIETTPYLLVVGSLNNRKGIENAVKAFLQSDSLSQKYRLVIVGSTSHHFTKTDLFTTIAQSDQITVRSRVTDCEMANLYQHAELLLAPYIYEGFGLPILEALYFNTPVLANDLEVFRELFQDGIHYVNSNDIFTFETSINYTLKNSPSENSYHLKRYVLRKLSYLSAADVLLELLDQANN